MKKTFLYSSFFLVIVLTALSIWWFKSDNSISLKPATFNQLPAWRKAELGPSLETFKVSCQAFLKQRPEKAVGSTLLNLEAKDWQPICNAAMSINPSDNTAAKHFFEQWFQPIKFVKKQRLNQGLFTGYYMPYLHGSLQKTEQYKVPLYAVPDDLITLNLSDFDSKIMHKSLSGRVVNKRLIPYYTREQISKGAIKDKATVLVWVDSQIDRLFLEIQGSGVVQLPDGQELVLGYAAQNGAPYTAIGKVLIERGALPKQGLSMQAIRDYLEAHPEEIKDVLNQNQSFVFFKQLQNKDAYGAQGVALTPGYSLAVDRQWIPLGAPIWLSTSHPDAHHKQAIAMQRLMIAQDTGGAIKGAVRGDVYWGTGDDATYIAGHMQNPGYYWLLLPKTFKLP